MIIDLNKIELDPFKNKIFDICICGAGVAGITLALKLSQKLNVVLLEGGGIEYSDNSQDIYNGKSVGQKYYDLTATRLRYFGGTSNHWGGWCHPLDSHDFTSKPYVKYSGWPIERGDLEPYLKEAEFILDLTKDSGEGRSASQHDLGNAIGNSDDFTRIGYKWSNPPTNFGDKYRDEIARMPKLACYLNANVVDMKLFENRSVLEHVEVRNFAGNTVRVRAKTFVLAAGGIENPRILLNCNSQITAGLGNENGLVGRFFTEHNNQTVAGFVLEDRIKEYLAKNWVADPHKVNRYFSPSLRFMERNRILNFGIFVEFYRRPGSTRGFKETLKFHLCDSELAQRAVEILQGKAMRCPPIGDGQIRVTSEQTLNPLSRISLGSEIDRFGMRKIVLDWRLSKIDKRTIQRATVRLGELFASLGLGRVRIVDWLLSKGLDFPSTDGMGTHHHMCTTRMSASPRDGVVDSNQKVFGINNLYLAGSSVFSTAGHDSPTITIVQMTMRLADHLNGIHKARI